MAIISTYGTVNLKRNEAEKVFNDEDDFKRECFFLNYCKNFPNICRIKNFDSKSKKIVMKRYNCDLLDLSEKLELHERIHLSQFILEKMLKVIQNLHYNGIIHCDIKMENIFCDYEEIEKNLKRIDFHLGDFSISRFEECNIDYNYNGYMNPPEYNKKITKQTDIWMLGATIINFITKKTILYENNEIGYFDFEKCFPEIHFPKDLTEVLKKLLMFNPQKRMKFEVCDEAIKIDDFEDYNPNNLAKLCNNSIQYKKSIKRKIIIETLENIFNENQINIKAKKILNYIKIKDFRSDIRKHILESNFLNNIRDRRYIESINKHMTDSS